MGWAIGAEFCIAAERLVDREPQSLPIERGRVVSGRQGHGHSPGRKGGWWAARGIRPLTSILKQAGKVVYVLVKVADFAGWMLCIARATLAAGLGLFLQRSGLGVVKRPGNWVAGRVHATEELDPPLGPFQHPLARREVFDAMLVAGQRLGQAERAALQLRDDRFELG